jgi:hypothetical protein
MTRTKNQRKSDVRKVPPIAKGPVPLVKPKLWKGQTHHEGRKDSKSNNKNIVMKLSSKAKKGGTTRKNTKNNLNNKNVTAWLNKGINGGNIANNIGSTAIDKKKNNKKRKTSTAEATNRATNKNKDNMHLLLRKPPSDRYVSLPTVNQENPSPTISWWTTQLKDEDRQSASLRSRDDQRYVLDFLGSSKSRVGGLCQLCPIDRG